MELWLALGTGLAGSMHCLGMCGPIALALPATRKGWFNRLAGRLAYNLGRAVTYAALGIIVGFMGQLISFAGWQQRLSIFAGVLMLLVVLWPSRYSLIPWRRFSGLKLPNFFTNWWGKLFAQERTDSLFLIGLLNGFLPCGLVYIALAGAATTAEPLLGGLYMFVFGLGTLPVMLLLSLTGSALAIRFKERIRKLVPVGVAVIAVLFILRGMSLGIPYVSPKMNHDHNSTTQAAPCCH